MRKKHWSWSWVKGTWFVLECIRWWGKNLNGNNSYGFNPFFWCSSLKKNIDLLTQFSFGFAHATEFLFFLVLLRNISFNTQNLSPRITDARIQQNRGEAWGCDGHTTQSIRKNSFPFMKGRLKAGSKTQELKARRGVRLALSSHKGLLKSKYSIASV